MPLTRDHQRTIIPSLLRKGAAFPVNGSLRDELLIEEIFDTLYDAQPKLALCRYDYNTVRRHSSLGNQTPLAAHLTLEHFEGSAPRALTTPETDVSQNQTRRLSQ